MSCKSSKDGVCCSCGYAGEEETPCLAREDGVHCVHWYDGPEFLEDFEYAVGD